VVVSLGEIQKRYAYCYPCFKIHIFGTLIVYLLRFKSHYSTCILNFVLILDGSFAKLQNLMSLRDLFFEVLR